MAKKRKTEMEPPEDSGFYQAFMEAANSVGQLFAQAQKERRAAAAAGSRAALERLADWLDSQGSSDTVSKSTLKQFLNEEHMKAGGGGLCSSSQRAPPEVQQDWLPHGATTSTAPSCLLMLPGQQLNSNQGNYIPTGTGSFCGSFPPAHNNENLLRQTNPYALQQFGGATGSGLPTGHEGQLIPSHGMHCPHGQAYGHP